MKHPFHTLFFIGLSTMLFVGTFLSLLVINIKDILPSTFGKSEPQIVNQDPIVATPIEKVVPKENPKPILVSEPIGLKPIIVDTLVKEIKTIDSSKTL